jgi:hypothetical protein
MEMELELDFEAQNKRILSLLRAGKSINRIEAIQMGITALNSRISDLRNRQKIAIDGVWEKEYKCKRYTLAA